MGYAERQLVAGEEILYRARYHWVFYRKAIFGTLLAAAVAIGALYAAHHPGGEASAPYLGYLSGGLLILSAVGFLVLYIRSRSDEFVVTDRRVIHKLGVFAHETRQCPLSKVQDITVDQGFLGRLLGYGSVWIETASEAGQMAFPSISNPEGLRTAIWTHVGTGGVAAAPQGASGHNAAERLQSLQELKAKGLLTPEEFERKRKELVRDL